MNVFKSLLCFSSRKINHRPRDDCVAVNECKIDEFIKEIMPHSYLLAFQFFIEEKVELVSPSFPAYNSSKIEFYFCYERNIISSKDPFCIPYLTYFTVFKNKSLDKVFAASIDVKSIKFYEFVDYCANIKAVSEYKVLPWTCELVSDSGISDKRFSEKEIFIETYHYNFKTMLNLIDFIKN